MGDVSGIDEGVRADGRNGGHDAETERRQCGSDRGEKNADVPEAAADARASAYCDEPDEETRPRDRETALAQVVRGAPDLVPRERGHLRLEDGAEEDARKQERRAGHGDPAGQAQPPWCPPLARERLRSRFI